MKNSKISAATHNAMGFLLGSTFLCTAASFHKYINNAPCSIKGFLLPFVFGGFSGFIITHLFFKTTILAQKLMKKNRDLEDMVQKRTSELQEKNKLLEKISNTDALTSIANRRHFDATIKQECDRLRRLDYSLSLVMCDIDYFKIYNDLYGHQRGDECLRLIAGALNSVARRSIDCVARYGGEEFALILPGTELNEATQLSEKAREAVENLGIRHDGSKIADITTMSFGVASVTSKHKEPDYISALISKADECLYQAKASGRNKIVNSTL